MALDSPTPTSSSGTRASLFRAVAPDPRDVLPFRGSSGTRASLLGTAPGPPQRRASLLGFIRETCFPFFARQKRSRQREARLRGEPGKGSTVLVWSWEPPAVLMPPSLLYSGAGLFHNLVMTRLLTRFLPSLQTTFRLLTRL